MVALLYALKDLGADQEMIKPIQKIMVNGHLAFFVLVVVTYVISIVLLADACSSTDLQHCCYLQQSVLDCRL